MSGAVNVNKRDFLEKARIGWGAALPAWVQVMADEASRTTASAVARRIGYSVSAVSAVLSGAYKGDLGAVEARVRGAYMGEIVECPVLGEIARDHCMEEQARKYVATSATRTKLFRACRGGCAHSRLTTKEAPHGR